jgi:hypothetical protein
MASRPLVDRTARFERSALPAGAVYVKLLEGARLIDAAPLP